MTRKSTHLTVAGRRAALRKILGAAALGVPAVASVARAARHREDDAPAELPHVSENDPLAKSLMYVQDATQAAAARKPDSFCHNCRYFKGEQDVKWGGCQIFVGKAVNANGWCKVWAAKES